MRAAARLAAGRARAVRRHARYECVARGVFRPESYILHIGVRTAYLDVPLLKITRGII